MGPANDQDKRDAGLSPTSLSDTPAVSYDAAPAGEWNGFDGDEYERESNDPSRH